MWVPGLMNASTGLQERARVDAPLSSTGVQMPDGTGGVGRLGIGWAQGTTHATGYRDVLGWLGELFGAIVERKRGLQWYRRAWSIGTGGVVVADGPVSGWSDPAEVYIVIPQTACDALGWDGSMRLLALLDVLGVRLSRLDVYYDDLRRIADPRDVMAAVEGGQTRSRVKSWREVRDHEGGMTAYLGSRTGECMVRVYRKWAESGDPSQGVRWEMEAKGERAPIVAALIRSAAAPAVQYFELVRAFVDFVDRSDGARGSRSPLLGWWAELVGSAGRATLAVRVVVDSLARKLAWVRRQVTPTLAVLFHAYGSAGISDLIAEGYPRARFELLAAPG